MWRYLREAVGLIAARADDLTVVMRRAARLAYAILDGTLIPIDRVADQRPYYSGKHKRHGMNVQVLADAAGRLVWASPALPGSVHDFTAARTHSLIDALTSTQRAELRGQGLPRRPRHRLDPIQTPPHPPVPPVEVRQPAPRQDPSRPGAMRTKETVLLATSSPAIQRNPAGSVSCAQSAGVAR